MRKINGFYNRINAKIITLMLVLFIITTLVVGLINQRNVRNIYEKTYTERLILSNNLITALIDGEDVKALVEILRKKDKEFKKRQIQFYYEREELFGLKEKKINPERQTFLLNRMKAFHSEMRALKTDQYWNIIESLKTLRDLSHSKYVYVFADTGVVSDEGEKLYTYIFDADDDNQYDSPNSDGLGTVNVGEAVIPEIYESKKSMKTVMYYSGEYGELYFAYGPVLDKDGNVIAILGTDVDLNEMYQEISKSGFLFNVVFLSFFITMSFVTYIFINHYITSPLRVLTVTAKKLADGDVYTTVPDTVLKQRSELGILAYAVNDMIGVYLRMITSAESLFAATKIGKLLERSDVSKYKGDMKKVIHQINDTLDAMTLYLNCLPEGISIMSKNLEMYFRNEQFIKFFGDISAFDFVAKMFPEAAAKSSELPGVKLAELLGQEYNNTIIRTHEYCFSVIIKEICLSEDTESSVMAMVVDISDLMAEKEKAQAAAQAKSDFLSRMSHEMRTPMNAIIGMAKIAENTDDISRLKYCLATIGTSSRLLLSIINDVLDMSKIEAGKFELEKIPFNLKTMLNQLGNIISENINRKRQTFTTVLGENLELNYSGDELRLSQVITNLLSNAAKFTAENGEITLSVSELSRSNDSSVLRFSVTDTGIGMTPEQIKRLFTSFEQADGSITRRFGGTGLGLAICKNIVEKMGGSIAVVSEPGRGSTFSFDIKLERLNIEEAVAFYSADNAVSDLQKAAPDFSGVHVLLAEDVEINREIIIMLLEETKISIDTAENGLIAVSKFSLNPDKYDLILMDIQMPEMDGYGATRAIRSLDHERAKTIPIIALTANAFREDIDRCLECGMNDHLSKPIDEEAIIKKIKRYSRKLFG